ncbi:cell surface protein [Campylobacter fetus]|uniref:beta strand repeat-containing protein n=4 Tax=Campylobacter fetus TaxID=196 RepID=UPI00140782E2|nr:cell surface protein [Campylobacter fetus]QNH10156.1 cell surface protein [Campylobacter fetus]WKW19394.1 cell surface protein [Campylobacter fetus subsp. fetus]WNY80436.1 cell surface protein [Campylobacter fetus subsp. fetus]
MLNKTDVSMLYITIMGMASEGDGNKYWLDYANNNSLGVSSLANIMLDSPGAAKFFGDSLLAGNEKDFVTKIYSIALGNTSDVDGINYWTKAITGGGEFTDSKGNVISVASLSKGDLIGAMINSMVNGGSAESKAIFEAKAAASDYFADATLGKDISGLDEGTTSKLISEINSASDLDKVKSEIDGLKESIDEAGLNKIALTTENDTITGTEGGDLISGVVSSLASENTLNAGDVIDGGAGSDILKVDLKSNFTGLDSSGVIKGVEKISLLNSGLISRTFDAKGIKDVQTLALNSEKGIEVKNLANIADIELTNLQAANFNVDSIYADKVLDGSADVQNLKVNGVGAKGASVAITADKIENLSLNATGKDSFLKDITSKDVSVKGNANITLEVKAGVNSLDASASSGKVSADLKAADVKTVKGGSGDDKFVVGTKVANVNVDGGAGNDELEINGAGTLKPTVANVEKVTLDATGALTLAMDNAKDVSELNIKGDTGGVIVLNSNISSLNFLSTVEGINAVTIDSENLATINYKAGTDAKAAAEASGKVNASEATNLTINLEANTKTTNTNAEVIAEKATSITLNVAEVKEAHDIKLSTPKATSLNVESKSVGGTKITAVNATDLDKLQNLNVVTDGKFDIATAATLKGISTINLSGENAKSQVDLSAVALGDAAAAQGIVLNASGLKGGLSTKSISTKGDIVANLNNTTGTVSLGSATTKTGNVTIAVNGATNSVNTGDLQATAGSVVVNAEGSNGAITVGNVTAASASITSGSGSTTIGTVAAGSVAIDLSSTLGDVAVGKITSDNVLFNGAKLKDNGTAGTITIDASTGANFVATVNGGLGKDALTVKGSATTETIKIAGDLGLGGTTPADQKLTLDLDASTKLSSLDISGLKGLGAATAIDLKNVVVDNKLIVDIKGNDAAETITVATPTATLTEIKLSGDLDGGENSISITPTAAAVALTTIDLSGLTFTGGSLSTTITLLAEHIKIATINGSLGADTITVKDENKAVAIDLGKDTAVDIVDVSVVKTADISTDEKIAEDLISIANFNTGDSIKFKANIASYTNKGAVDGATLKDAIASANGDVANSVYGFTWKGDTYLVFNTTNGSGNLAANDDQLVKLIGTSIDLDSLNASNTDIIFA